MKTRVEYDWDRKALTISMTLEQLEEAGPAIDFVKNSARALWPHIVFSDEPEFEEDDAPTASGAASVAPTATAPGLSPSLALTLTFVRELGRVDANAVARRFEISKSNAWNRLSTLRKSGHLEGLE